METILNGDVLFQDAVEFFMSLIDIVDEALKALNYEQTMSKILGGLISDQVSKLVILFFVTDTLKKISQSVGQIFQAIY
jgi:hypothetical protein